MNCYTNWENSCHYINGITKWERETSTTLPHEEIARVLKRSIKNGIRNILSKRFTRRCVPKKNRCGGSLQSRHFLTKTRRYIDQSRHLENQRKRLRGRSSGRGEGRRGQEKTPASKAYEINERPLTSRAWLLCRKCKRSQWKSISLLFR